MILRSNNSAAKSAAPKEKPADASSQFQTPSEYRNGSRKRLKDFHSGDWWLNVDYVVSETFAA